MSVSSEKEIDATIEQFRMLVDWARRVRAEDIPREVLKHAALVIADDVAVAISTQDEPEVSRFQNLMLDGSGAAEATVIRAGAPRADRYSAAVANTLATATAELACLFLPGPCHAGLFTVPVLCAEAEAGNLSGIEVLRAEVLAYEITARLSLAWKGAQDRYGTVYTHGRLSSLGAAAATALARVIDTEVFLQSLWNAATLSNVTPQNNALRGATVRDTWPAAGAWSGMMSVRWAQCGFSGLPSSLYDVFSGVLGYVAVPAALGSALGADWAVLQTSHRTHACPLVNNAVIEALLELRPRIREASLDDIEQIRVEVPADKCDLVNPAPATTLAARFSFPHVVATTLFHGHASAAAFSSATLELPAIDRLRHKVAVAPFDMSNAVKGYRYPAAVSITMRGGAVHSARCTKPLGVDGVQHPSETILRKIEDLSAAHHPRFGRAARELVALDPRHLDAPWSRFMREALGA